jgi:hypothetical protein
VTCRSRPGPRGSAAVDGTASPPAGAACCVCVCWRCCCCFARGSVCWCVLACRPAVRFAGLLAGGLSASDDRSCMDPMYHGSRYEDAAHRHWISMDIIVPAVALALSTGLPHLSQNVISDLPEVLHGCITFAPRCSHRCHNHLVQM